MVTSSVHQRASDSRFLIIGCDNQVGGEGAAASTITNAVDRWQLPAVETMVVSRLCTHHAIALAKADYVIFVDTCGSQGHARSLQVQPLTSNFSSSFLAGQGENDAEDLCPRSLLNLTCQRYGDSPLAWLIELPAECGAGEQALSATAQASCDRALRTIAQFLQTYQKPNYPAQDRLEAPRVIYKEALNCA